MNHTVYLKLSQITELTHKDVVLKDVAQVYCDDQNVMNKCNSMKVMTVKVDAKRRYIMSALDVINKLKQLDSTIDVNNVGETDFIIAYKPPSPPAYIWQWTKTVFVCLVCFFGAAPLCDEPHGTAHALQRTAHHQARHRDQRGVQPGHGL